MSYGRKQHTVSRQLDEFIRPIQIMAKVKGEDGLEKVVVLDPKTHEHLKSGQHNSKFQLLPIIDKFDKINVSSALQSTNRLLYPKVAKKSSLDDLLKRRIELKSIEEKKIATAAEIEPPANVIAKPKARPYTEIEKELQKIVGMRVSVSSGAAIAAIPNLDMEFVTKLAREIQVTRSQFSKLNRVAKNYKCYSGCDVNASTFSLLQVKTATCFSPLCLRKARVKRDLLLLLRKAHNAGNGCKETGAAIMNIVNRKPSILEAKLTEGKLSSGSESNADTESDDPAKLESNLLAAAAEGNTIDDENDILKYIVIRDESIEAKEEHKAEEPVTIKEEPIKMEISDEIKSEIIPNGTDSNSSDEPSLLDETMQPVAKRQRLNASTDEINVISNHDEDANPSTVMPELPITDIEKDDLLNSDDTSRESRRSSRRSVKNRTSVKTTTTTTRTTTKYSDGSEEQETNSVMKSSLKDINYEENRTLTTTTDTSIVRQSQYVRKPNRRFAATAKAIKRDTTLQEVKEVADNGIERIYSRTSTSGRVYLAKATNLDDPNKMAIVSRADAKAASHRYPPMPTFMTQRGVRSLMALHRYELRKLGRTGGRQYINGFNMLLKQNSAAWPYPCSRPSFKLCWVYRTMNARTLSAVALQIRILWCCLRWDDMSKRPPTHDGKFQETTETEISTMEILKHRVCGPFSERTQYLRRKVVIPLEMPKTIRGKCWPYSIRCHVKLNANI